MGNYKNKILTKIFSEAFSYYFTKKYLTKLKNSVKHLSNLFRLFRVQENAAVNVVIVRNM